MRAILTDVRHMLPKNSGEQVFSI